MDPTDPTDAGLDAPLTDDDGVPDFRAARRHVLIETLRLAAALRREGVSVPTSGSLSAARALATVGLDDRSTAEAALRATLVSGASGLDAFDGAFPEFWHRLRSGLDAIATDHEGPTPGDEADEGKGSSDEDPDSTGL
ncbi:MAG: hypothetical protein ABEH58_06015, partial [Haloplanus sp.]